MKIGTYQREVPPTVQIERTAGLPGAQMQKEADLFGEVVATFDKARMLDQHNRGSLKFLEGIEKVKQEARDDPDFYGVTERSKAKMDELKKQVLKETPDPIVAKSLGERFDADAVGILSDIDNVAKKGQVSSLQASGQAILEGYARSYVKADQRGKADLKTKIEDQFKDLEASKAFWPDQIQEMRQKFWNNLRITEVQEDILQVGPGLVRAALEKKDRGPYPDLQPDQRMALIQMTYEREGQLKKIAAGGDKTDPKVEAELMRRVYAEGGPTVSKEDILKLALNGLSVDDANKWVKEREVMEKQTPVGIAMQEVDRAITTVAKAEGWDFSKEIQVKANIRAKVGKAQSVEEALKIVKAEVEPYKEGFWKKALDAWAWTMTHNPPALAGQAIYKAVEGDKNSQKRLPGETIEQYLKRTQK